MQLRLTNPLSPLLDAGFVETVLRRQFRPLLDPRLSEMLSARYPHGVSLVVNGHLLEPESAGTADEALLFVRLGRRRKPVAGGYLAREREPLPEDERGLAISTLGKVIKRGWDWLGLAPASAATVHGLVEAPALAETLTLNKADFLRTGSRGGLYLAYRRAIQEAVAHQLSRWGDAPDADDRTRRRVARPVERDLETVLVDLAETFPLLSALVERRAGGQRRLPAAGPAAPAGAATVPTLTGAPAVEEGRPVQESSPEVAAEPAQQTAPRESTITTLPPGPASPPAAARRPARYGLQIQFEHRPNDVELGRLVESTVWVNEAHPAYRRAVASRAEGYHVALAVALALATVAVEPAKEHGFVTAFLSAWGAAVERRRSSRRR